MRTTTASVPNVSSSGVDAPAQTVSAENPMKFSGNWTDLAAELAELIVPTAPRIIEVDPVAAVGLDGLREDLLPAAIDLALGCIYLVSPKPFAPDSEATTNCRKCGATAEAGVALVHRPECAADRILSYVRAVNDARMGVERRPEMNSLRLPGELFIEYSHLFNGNRSGYSEHLRIDHHGAAAARAIGAAFPLVPVVVDAREGGIHPSKATLLESFSI